MLGLRLCLGLGLEKGCLRFHDFFQKCNVITRPYRECRVVLIDFHIILGRDRKRQSPDKTRKEKNTRPSQDMWSERQKVRQSKARQNTTRQDRTGQDRSRHHKNKRQHKVWYFCHLNCYSKESDSR
jgi:hypothetical protein